MRNLRLQGSTYHARLVIPKDVRHKFGNKSEFSQSLETGSYKLAQVRGADIVAGWKREIHIAREGLNHREWAKDWAKARRIADDIPSKRDLPSKRDEIEMIMTDVLEDLVDRGELNQRQAEQAFEIAVGQRVILGDHRDDYLKQYSTHSIKTQAAYSAALAHFFDKFKESTEVTTRSIKLWMTHLVDEKRLGQETIGRSLRQAQSFWQYLVEHEIVSRDKNPFDGVKLSVPKHAAKTSSYEPFTPAEVVTILHLLTFTEN